MKLQTFLLIALLFSNIASSYSHEIQLKNGKTIHTENVWIESDIVKFEQYGGVISIPRNRVKEIVYRETRNHKPDAFKKFSYDKNISPSSGKNLAAGLEAKLIPKTPLEKACMCTLAIKTGSGFGSGFFISEDGFIITNKHIVRGDNQQNSQMNEEFEQYLGNLKEFKKQLDNEYKEIVKYKADLKREWALFRDLQRIARTNLDRRYLESQRIALIDFKNYLLEKEKNYKISKKDYLIEKNKVDKQFKKFLSEQKQQAVQVSFEIILADDTTLYAKLFKVSSKHDLALLKLSGYQTPYLKSVGLDDLSQGQNVYALGSPISLSMKNTITSGVLSGFRENFIQTNAQIYPGNSGGPLINDNGEVIGVMTMKMISSEFDGPGFAIPIGVALAEFKNHLQGK